MKKRIFSLLLAVAMLSSMFTMFAFSSSAEDLTENTVLEPSDPEYADANAGLQTLLNAGSSYEQKGPAVGNSDNNYFAYFYNYYYYRVTLPENQVAPTAVAYKALVDKVYNWIYGEEFAGKVVYGFTGIADTLEAAWQAMRAEIVISNPLKDKRNAYMTEHDLWDNNLGKYTADSWATYWAAVEAIDSAAKDGTDADCNAAYEAFLQAAANLKETGTMFDPQRKAAYDRATSDLVGKPLYMHYVDRAYGLFTNSELWEDPEAVQAFLDKAEEADMLFLEPYDDSIDYTVWFPAGLSAEELANADMLMEQLWYAARDAAYIGRNALEAKRWSVYSQVKEDFYYTPDSYALWQEIWTDASNNIDNIKNSSTATDQDGYDAVQGCLETLEVLVDAVQLATPEQEEAARAAKAEVSAAADNKYGNYLGYFLEYGDRITLDESKENYEVKKFFWALETCKTIIADSENLYAPYLYGVDWNNVYGMGNLETWWQEARAIIPLMNGLQKMRDEKLNANVEDWLAGYQLGTSWKYTDETFAAIIRLIDESDALKNNKTSTDAQGKELLAKLDTAIANLEERNPVYDKDNFAAYANLDNVLNTYFPLLGKFTLEESRATEEYIALENALNELDMIVIEAYDNDYDYSKFTDATLEPLWFAAREVCHIGPVLITERDEILATIGPKESYTADSWAVWESLKTDLINKIDDTKNSATATDADGIEAIQDLKDAVNMLEKDPSYVLYGLIEAETPEDIAAAQAAKNEIAAAASNKYGNYLGYFIEYGDRITLDESKEIPAVKEYFDALEICKALLGTDTLYMPYYYGVDWNNIYGHGNLETWWNAARSELPISNGLSNMRNAKLDESVEGWLESYGLGSSWKYTDETFAAIVKLVDEGDAIKNTCTDAQGYDFLARLDSAIAALEERDPVYDKDNYTAYINFTQLYNTYSPLLAKFTLEESRATEQYKAFAAVIAEMEVLANSEYSNDTDYTQYGSEVLDPLWYAAREVCHIGPILQTERDAILATIKDESEYTPITWELWISVKDDIINHIDDVKNSLTATDADGVEAIKDLQDAVDALILKVNKPAADTPAAPEITGKTYNSITVAVVDNAEYGIRAEGEEEIKWQSSNVFTDLEKGIQYYLSVRILEDDNYKPSEPSEETAVQLGKPGDANGDDKITLEDAMISFNALAGKVEMTGDLLSAIDLNGNGKAELTEVMKIFMVVAGKIEESAL